MATRGLGGEPWFLSIILAYLILSSFFKKKLVPYHRGFCGQQFEANRVNLVLSAAVSHICFFCLYFGTVLGSALYLDITTMGFVRRGATALLFASLLGSQSVAAVPEAPTLTQRDGHSSTACAKVAEYSASFAEEYPGCKFPSNANIVPWTNSYISKRPCSGSGESGIRLSQIGTE